MNDFRELNVGDECLIRVRVREVKEDFVHFDTIDERGKRLLDCSFALMPDEYDSILMAGDLQPCEPKPKDAPCRFFRKGDEVRVLEERAGRIPPLCGDIEPGGVYIVSDDEDGGDVMLAVNDSFACIDWFWLELVTPVEAMEPYSVADNIFGWLVYKGNTGNVVANFNKTHPHAKEAAEDECDRLNAEWRKERE